MNTKNTSLLLAGIYCLLLFSACKKEEISESKQEPIPNNSFVDSRDNQSYKTVQIGSQIWMAENLKFKSPNSLCYDNNPENCIQYGRLYDWEEAMTACPDGWRLPTFDDWVLLGKIVGESVAGKVLKSESGWSSDGNGTNERKFNALPGGKHNVYYPIGFDRIGDFGYWWSSSEFHPQEAWTAGITYNSDYLILFSSGFKVDGHSCRCLKK